MLNDEVSWLAVDPVLSAPISDSCFGNDQLHHNDGIADQRTENAVGHPFEER